MISKNTNAKFGTYVLFLVFLFMFGYLAVSFFVVQVQGTAKGEDLRAKIDALHMKKEVIRAGRGSILDSTGQLLANDTVSYSLVAVLSPNASKGLPVGKYRHVIDEEKTANGLAQYIPLSEQEILTKLLKKNDANGNEIYQVEFGNAGKNINSTTKNKIDSLKLPGIIFNSYPKRFYPNGIFASNVIGIVQKDENTEEIRGVLGLEAEYDKYLAGTDGKKEYPTDNRGRILPNSAAVVTKPKNGYSIQTTLNKKIQTFLEEAMSRVNETYKPEKMIGIVADAKTGAILGMSQRPSFNLMTKEGISDAWTNLAIGTSYEPGSTFKIITLAGAVNEGVFDPLETFNSKSYAVPGNPNPIMDFNQRDRGEISYLQGLQFSSNVGFAKLGMEKLGPEKMLDYIYKFGFSEKTGIDLPQEVNSNIAYKYNRDKANTMFGQATAITPIQQVQALTAITNKGKMMKPYLVSEVVNPDTKKIVEKNTPTVVGEPITEASAQTVIDYLETVVSTPGATGTKFQLADYSVAGKTGTAQIPKKGGGYESGHMNSIFSFLGFAPANDPKVIMYVAIEKPNITEDQSGAQPVSEVFVPVMDKTLKYLLIDGSKASIINEFVVTLPDFVNDTTGAINSFKEINPENKFVEVGDLNQKIIKQYPPKNTEVIVGETIFLLYEGERLMPDLTGWSYRDVARLSELLGMELEVEGSGYVTEQSIAPETAISEKTPLLIKLVGS